MQSLRALEHACFLATRALRFAWRRNLLLVLALAFAIAVPLATRATVTAATHELDARAQETPLLLGSANSDFDLVFSALWFSAQNANPRSGTMADLALVEADDLAVAIPLALGLSARDTPVVGTTLDYFAFRKLGLHEGVLHASVGQCVLGSTAARALGLRVGDKIFTDPGALTSLAGIFPIELEVTGIFSTNATPDDAAIFVDLATAWTIRGVGHFHRAPKESDRATGAVIGTNPDGTLIAGEALRIENEPSTARVKDFHFHGDLAQAPMSAAIVIPKDAKSQAILLGRFDEARRSDAAGTRPRLVRPFEISARVSERIYGVERLLDAVALASLLATLLVVALAFALGIKLRADELRVMQRMGASRGRVALFLMSEGVLVLALATTIALGLAAAASTAAPSLVAWIATS
ncbi:MAG: FtsX-like permease family protein [Phycisphaerales bacterium]|nr:FtsX-like permease family protein [Phycisphaerales bacterium]